MDIQSLFEKSSGLRAVIDSLPDPALVFGAEGKCIWGNPALYRLIGADPTEPRWQSFPGTLNLRRVDGQAFPMAELASTRALQGETVTGQVLTFTDHHGHDCIVEYTAAPIKHNGDIIGAIGIARNLTEREQLKQSLKASLARTLKAKRQLESFAAALEQEVAARTEQVRSLSRALTLAEQRERVRFSRILHEDLQQILLATKMRLDMLAGRELAEDSLPADVSEISRLVKKAVETSKSLALEMNPPVLESEGLDAALLWLASHMQQRYGFPIETDIPDRVDLMQKEIGVLIIQIVREVLFSALKDPQPERLLLLAHCIDSHLHVAIEVTGNADFWDIARDVWRSRENWAGIEERLKLFGGTAELITVDDSTLRTHITLPMAG